MVTESEDDLNYIPVRGDVVDINCSPQAGKEIWDRRPALVISSWDFNYKKNLAVLCPITKTKRGQPFEIEIPEGLDVHGVVLADQVRSLDWQARKAVFWCKMPDDTVTAVSQIVETIIWGE
jgi:mRNA interferase MazF